MDNDIAAAAKAIKTCAVAHGLTLQEAFDEMAEHCKRRQLWGSMPDEYDPAKDPSHPNFIPPCGC